jgi:hypothetical protein
LVELSHLFWPQMPQPAYSTVIGEISFRRKHCFSILRPHCQDISAQLLLYGHTYSPVILNMTMPGKQNTDFIFYGM